MVAKKERERHTLAAGLRDEERERERDGEGEGEKETEAIEIHAPVQVRDGNEQKLERTGKRVKGGDGDDAGNRTKEESKKKGGRERGHTALPHFAAS